MGGQKVGRSKCQSPDLSPWMPCCVKPARESFKGRRDSRSTRTNMLITAKMDQSMTTFRWVHGRTIATSASESYDNLVKMDANYVAWCGTDLTVLGAPNIYRTRNQTSQYTGFGEMDGGCNCLIVFLVAFLALARKPLFIIIDCSKPWRVGLRSCGYFLQIHGSRPL
jgi:hypothetical protein